ncbi:hypothetical protein JTE90_007610 [Oedothorax gibbosus]|uniref:Uncharacterized protein n=1 Tax=Oedothorax gibbosus TaxID=931172 RepID=A0AAV6THR8_9ARAC|nr:hypothetical protein JTE90_007610 [Oedothorax gibbosus]
MIHPRFTDGYLVTTFISPLNNQVRHLFGTSARPESQIDSQSEVLTKIFNRFANHTSPGTQKLLVFPGKLPGVSFEEHSRSLAGIVYG